MPGLSRRQLVALAGSGAFAQDIAVRPAQQHAPNAGPERFGDGRDWFFQRRFGLFIHWGLYAIPAWHEQHMYRMGWTRKQYEPLARQFRPRRFDPHKWIDAANATGMEYLCLTAKHIDGFCLWDTRETAFNVMNTPYGKDVVHQVADACHRRGMPLELYYSVVDGWHPNYPNAGRPHEFKAPQPGDEPDLQKYVDFVRRQIRELCSNYGEVHGIWFDANHLKHRDPSFREMIRSLQPKAIINNRGFDEGDYGTPERDYDASVNTAIAFDKPVEACESVGYQSWGYRQDEDYHHPETLIQGMHRVMAKGGNYLLNVGPTADGELPREALDLLGKVGSWYRSVKESLVDVERGPRLSGAPNMIATRRGEMLYIHVLAPLPTGSIYVHPIEKLPNEAVLLNSGKRLECDVATLPRLFNQNPRRCLRVRGLPADAGSGNGLVIRLRYAV